MKTLRALDLYCGAGSVSIGLRNGGFARVEGIDNNPELKRYYPYKFTCANVLELSVDYLQQFDFIWASPPCQFHTSLLKGREHTHLDLIPQTRALLDKSGVPYVIENVEGAKTAMRIDLCLCGSMFQLHVRRHRIFETSFRIRQYYQHSCKRFKIARFANELDTFDSNWAVDVAGHNYGSTALWNFAMGETTRQLPKTQLAQAIPPIYAQHIAEQAVRHIYRVNG